MNWIHRLSLLGAAAASLGHTPLLPSEHRESHQQQERQKQQQQQPHNANPILTAMACRYWQYIDRLILFWGASFHPALLMIIACWLWVLLLLLDCDCNSDSYRSLASVCCVWTARICVACAGAPYYCLVVIKMLPHSYPMGCCSSFYWLASFYLFVLERGVVWIVETTF